MLNNDYISASEQLSALLDGELNVESNPQLFYSLAQNPDLQSELQDLITLRNKMSSMQIQPPENLKKNILIGTGLIASGTTLNTTPVNNAVPTSILKRALLSKPFLMALTATMATMLTIFITTQKQSTAEPSKPLQAKNILNDIPKVVAQDNSAKPAQVKIIYVPKEVIKYITLDNKIAANTTDNNIIKESNSSVIDNSKNVNLELNKAVIDYNYLANQYNNQRFISGINLPPLEYENLAVSDIHSRLLLQMRGFSTSSYYGNEIPSLIAPTMNNIGLSLLYEWSDNSALGVEIGQENFQQHFYADDKGTQRHYEQNYLGFWYGATYKYTFNQVKNIFGVDLKPFFQVFGGGTKVGGLTKGIIGLQLEYKNNVYMFFGADGSLLCYKLDSNYFFTKKAGLTYGIGFKM